MSMRDLLTMSRLTASTASVSAVPEFSRAKSELGGASAAARSVLRHIRVASKKELKDRIIAAIDHFNGDPVVHTWSYRLDQAA